MPEGDTVWNTARVLDRALAGRRVTGSDFRVPRLAVTDLAGATVRGCVSRGKHLLLRLTLAGVPTITGPPAVDPSPASTTSPAVDPSAAVDPSRAGPDAWTLHSHLRMDGAWRTYRPDDRWTARPAHLIRVVLRTAEVVAVGYHLHDVALVPTVDEGRVVGHLGPDLLGPDWDPTDAIRRLTVDPARPLGEALLDQRNLAGLGTVYVAEVLFLSRVAPSTPVGDVADLPRVVHLAHRLLAANRGRAVRATTGDTGRGRDLWVYGRRGRPCRRCGTPVAQGRHGSGPSARLAYWCPSCQPPPPPHPHPPRSWTLGTTDKPQ